MSMASPLVAPRRIGRSVLALATATAVAAGVCRLTLTGGSVLPEVDARVGADVELPAALAASIERPVWPDQPLAGEPAKRLLVAFLGAAAQRLDHISSYTAVLLKQERFGSTLAPEETIDMKVRHAPFAVYLKYRGEKKGREALYVHGENDNKVVAHTGDWTSKLIPRLLLDPNGTIAMVENRHPITEAGLGHLAHRLLTAARRDVDDLGVVTVLDRVAVEGRSWLRSVQIYATPSPDRPLSRVEVCYDPATGLPLRFIGADWPEPGRDDARQLAESYRYEDLRLDAGLTKRDFDSDNPAYAFARF